MNNIELAEDNERKFNHFLKSVDLYQNDEPMVEFSPVQDEHDTLSGEIMVSTKKVRKILEKNLQQKPSHKNGNYDIWSFKLKGLGWIIIEKFEESSHMTLKNKWW
jgi:hypothetical protein